MIMPKKCGFTLFGSCRQTSTRLVLKNYATSKLFCQCYARSRTIIIMLIIIRSSQSYVKLFDRSCAARENRVSYYITDCGRRSEGEPISQ